MTDAGVHFRDALADALGLTDDPAADVTLDPGAKAIAQPPHDDVTTASDPAPDALAGRAYRHVTKALYERPWAVQRQMLTFMAGLLRFRAAGGVLSPEEIEERLAAARAQNGDRSRLQPYEMAGSVAVIPMYGLISQRMNLLSAMSGGTSLDEMRGALREALTDPAVRAVVFDIDSPGGQVEGITEFAAELRAARTGDKPIVAQVDTLAASAAYWLASQMSEIVTTPSGEVGSIGVFAIHEDFSRAEEMVGVKTTLISAGKYKVEGNEFEPLSDEARSAIQEGVDTFYHVFLADVAHGRGISTDAVATGYGEGRTLLAKKALKAGMVDRIDTLEATVQRLQRGGSLRRSAETPALEVMSAVVPSAELPTAAVAVAATHPDRAWNARMQAKVKVKRKRSTRR